MRMTKSPIFKFVAIFLAVNMLVQMILPTVAYALTAGPNSPEFSSFTPVATTDMVNVFSGDFNYNLPVVDIPGADGGGYSLSLSYNSGNSSEQEASWVGFGWNLNPGSINRSVRGFPDDYNNVPVDYYNKARPNWTTSMTLMGSIEAFSQDIPLSLNKSLRFNNYQGFHSSTGLGISFRGMASLGVNFDVNGVTFSADINPMGIVNATKKNTDEAQNKKLTVEDFKKLSAVNINSFKNIDVKSKTKDRLKGSIGSMLGSVFPFATFTEGVRATTYTPYSGYAFNWSASIQVNAYPPVGFEVGAAGNFNMQFNDKYLRPQTVSGYKYSSEATGLMDYYTEKDSPFDKRDLFIGMPFSNYDVYNVSGEGLIGGFRMFNEGVGHYRPQAPKSKLRIRHMGFETMVGWNMGVGMDFGFGSQSTTIDDWNKSTAEDQALFGDNTTYRFNHDLGGKIQYSANSETESGRLDLYSKLWGARATAVVAPGGGEYSTSGDTETSSYIQDIKLNDLAITTPDDISNPGEVTGGFQIFNDQGMRYKYGMPVFTKNETNISVDVQNGHEKIDRYLTFRDLRLKKSSEGYTMKDELQSDHYKTVVGEIRNHPYVNNYLLTEITTPDYIDLTGNGASYDDFGGWTKFNYRKKYGEDAGNWYRYRTPYRGLIYQQNAISDTKDDVGSVITGEKEVSYLATIETKTHIAYFVTNKSDFGNTTLKGSLRERWDGRGAIGLNSNGDPAAEIPGSGNRPAGTTELEYLEKIVILAKNRDGSIDVDKTPLKVVRFAYDWSLVPNVPNNSKSTFTYGPDANHNVAENSGKLTLKKVWFEYNGTVPARISPYEFSYAYKHSSLIPVEQEIFAEYDHLSETAQNPPYSPHLLDPWGNITPNIKQRQALGIPWVDQAAYHNLKPGSEDFDPAAWQLKSIKLPSGGEILVQYEEKDYAYVQDRHAMAMASLAGDVVTEGDYEKTMTYAVNIEDLGANPYSEAEANMLVKLANEYYKPDGEDEKKIYFRFLYALKGSNPALDNCKSEYISGYANLTEITARRSGTGAEDPYFLYIKVGSENSRDGEFGMVPRRACLDLVLNQKQGKLQNSDCVEPIYEALLDDLAAQAANQSQVGINDALVKTSLAAHSMGRMAMDPRVMLYPNDLPFTVCKSLSASQSFFKLPMLRNKKGGGIRVKRLLMYDEGIEEGDPVVYGSEYHYTLEDGLVSSGVATNEPTGAREENPLVSFLPKKDQSLFSTLTAGKDKEQTEGPLGESLLPFPSIGYSRIVVENIHSGNTGTGFTEHKYFTAKDYPFDHAYSGESVEGEEGTLSTFDVKGKGVEKTALEDEIDFMFMPAGLFNYSTNKVWLAQGFRFIINNMHGQIKKVSSFGGRYNPSEPSAYPVSMQEYNYFEPGEKIKMLTWDEQNQQIVETYETPGKEMEVAMESKRITDITTDFSIEVDISVTICVYPPVFVSMFPSFSHSDKVIATHSTTKVLRYPSILKSVTSMQDGVYNTQEYVAFDAATGRPLLTKTTDGFDKLVLGGSTEAHKGGIYSLTMPAHWYYPEMGQKAGKANPAQYSNQLVATAANFATYGEVPDKTWFAESELKNVLSASVQTYKSDWQESWEDERVSALYDLNGAAQDKLQKVMRPAATYVYKVDETLPAGDKVYNSGYYDINNRFNWGIPADGAQTDVAWVKTSNATKYSPNGQVLEEKNILGIPSAALYGYQQQVPVMVAQNAEFANIYFEDYEYIESADLTTDLAHSGKSSSIAASGKVLVTEILVTEKLKEEGGLLKLWLHFGQKSPAAFITTSVNGNTVELQKVSQTGQWALYSGEIKAADLPLVGNEILVVLEDLNTEAPEVLIDDVRFQPKNAMSTCYVYDPANLRLLVQFDDQHFGLYYQYNAEGQLVRKLIETERGMKTIEETQYNKPSKPRASL